MNMREAGESGDLDGGGHFFRQGGKLTLRGPGRSVHGHGVRGARVHVHVRPDEDVDTFRG